LRALPDCQRRPDRPLGVILVRLEEAEDREDAVSQEAVHLTLISEHRIHHHPKEPIDERDCVLGVQLAHRLDGAAHIGEQHRYQAVLSVRAWAFRRSGARAFG
jgi:hypothetical protein